MINGEDGRSVGAETRFSHLRHLRRCQLNQPCWLLKFIQGELWCETNVPSLKYSFNTVTIVYVCVRVSECVTMWVGTCGWELNNGY